jgi:predicted nucleic acid-binding protein
MREVLDPRRCNVMIDANALDRTGGARNQLVDRILHLKSARKINIVVPGSVHAEVQHPHTPQEVQRSVLPGIYTLPVERTGPENDVLRKVRALLQGNAVSGRHDADGLHLFEASKYGGGYFITHDKRLLKKRSELDTLLGPALRIVRLSEFLAIYDEFAER